MKQLIRYILTLAVLLTGGVGTSWALANSDIKSSIVNGSITVTGIVEQTSDYKVTITASPNTGYVAKATDFAVQPLVSPSAARRRTPGLAGYLDVSAGGTPNEFWFLLPKKYHGALVSATFLPPVTPGYYVLHAKDKGFLQAGSANVTLTNNTTLQYADLYNNGNAFWVLTQGGYLQNNNYYLNVAADRSLYLSVDSVTRWMQEDIDGDVHNKKHLKYNDGTTDYYLCNDDGIGLSASASNCYNTCPLTVNEMSWSGPSSDDLTVQSPQLVTHLRYYFTQKVTYEFYNDNGEKKTEANKDRRVYATLEYQSGADSYINDGVIYNKTAKDVTCSVVFKLLPADKEALAKHATPAEKTIKLKVQPQTVSTGNSCLLFSIKGGDNYRYPFDSNEGEDAISDNGPANPAGKGGTGNDSFLTDPDGENGGNKKISWKLTADEQGFYSFRNAQTNRYLYFDETPTAGSAYGTLRVGVADMTGLDDATAKTYKFRLYKTTDTDYGTCYQIIPYGKQFAIYKSDGAATGLMAALNVTQYSSNNVISLHGADANSAWCIYKYEAEYRVRTDFTISGPTTADATGGYEFTSSDGWYGKYITESPKTGNGQRGLVVNGTYNTDKINYTWTVIGLDDYIDHAGLTSQNGGYGKTNVNNNKQTFTVSTLPVSSASGVVQFELRGGDAKDAAVNPYRYSGKKTFAFTILGNVENPLDEIENLSDIESSQGTYKLKKQTSAITYSSSNKPKVSTFSGIIDFNGNTIDGLSEPLFETLTNGTVCNLNLKDVNISESGQVGAIARVANGGSRIYNVGILSGQVGSSDGYCGGLVGLLDGSARVINCFSYATITGGTYVGGLVGYNNYKSTATDLRTMVMNCMMYGDMTGGSNRAPVYNGLIIDNLQGGLNNFNYYAYSQLPTGHINTYNCALAVEDKYLERFEYYRLLLNSNKKLAAFYATNDAGKANQMGKWVLETADRTMADPKPYPVLRERAEGRFDPSIVNPDVDNAPDSTSVGPDKGGKLGKTLTVTIATTKSDGGQTWPSGASVTTPSLTLQRTDKDFERYNFNYDKVQLPYYNEVGEGNYTGNRVVTGWKITAITAVSGDPYTASNYDYTKTYASNGAYFDAPNYNFADRKSSNKDLYTVSGRIFAQGAYFDVPYGVTAITIEPYWAKAAYIADPNYDVVYKNDYTGKQDVAQTGTQVTVGTTMFKEQEQRIETKVANALSYISKTLGGYGPTVYDNAVVLVGNLHLDGVPSNGDTPFTMMSVDEDRDREPDYSLIYHHKGRAAVAPIRYDFLNIPGTAQAQKPNGASLVCNGTIYKTKGWFEITNTSSMYFSQFEYENVEESTKADAPLILMGGVIDQFVSTQKTAIAGNTVYLHLGGNLWIHELGLGTHSDGNKATPHVPVSVTGGDYEGFYLTGTYNANAAVQTDNAECYISSGRFGELAGASQEQIDGSVTWQIYNADITSFFGGGTNDAKPITGTITTTIAGSHVGTFCGGPKFGNMSAGKAVSTTATDCTFGTYFGAGYGGNSYSRRKYYDGTGPAWGTTLQGYYTADRGKYYNGTSTNLPTSSYGKKGPGVATDFDYEFFVWSSGQTGGRFFVKFVTFSLAQCNDVSTTLKHCKVTGSFYGGGSLGKVMGNVTSDLEDCEVAGNVFGAGYSATLPKIAVRDEGFTTPPSFNKNSGMFEPAGLSATTDYEWTHVDDYPSEGGAGFSEKQVITTQDLTMTNLGSVEGNVTLNITGSKTTVGGSIYGGGEESVVNGSTTVNVSSGTIGTTGKGGAEFGNVYGGGMGKDDNVMAGLVKGNTNVTISGTTTILHNVYGGGAYGSVGEFTYDATTGMPTARKENTTGGTTNVTITGGTIGTNGKENGMVFGSSRGDVSAPVNGVDPNDALAWVYSTHVVIGDATAETSPMIKGSVYGSGENGHTFQNTQVDIAKGTIGIAEGSPITDNNGTPNDESDDKTYSGAAYPYRGNVYGGGCGTDTYTVTENAGTENEQTSTHYNPLAGIVRGDATVTINGGHVVRNVYGAGAMGSVGIANTDGTITNGKTTIVVSGGTVGVDGKNGDGNVFGAARGEYGISTAASSLATVRESEVNISSTPTGNNDDKDEALITGSVFGGGEAGLVKGSVTVNMTGGLVLKDVYGGGALADTQTSNWDATNNTWATGKTSESATTTVRLTGGTIRGEAFGGGLGEAGKPAYVYGNVLLDLNGTTTPGGTTGTAIDEKARGCAVGEVFGCNNVNGTPKGTATVHVYATQNASNASKLQIANKTKDDYDVTAVYGGGNMAAYEPADLANGSTNVIIDGCALTSIKTVYGGGNAASTPATSVTVNGTYEIEEVFGGGNGKDALPDGSPNPGANVGFRDYSAVESTYPTKEDRQNDDFTNNYVYGTGKASVNIFGGTIHRVFGGSNTKGNVRETAVTLLEEANSCDLCIDEAYGGGKSAPMDAEAKLLMSCLPGLKVAYGGAEAADIQGNVTLNITNGTFDRVFGGNNISGTIHGTITVNVEEIGCKPVIIGQLYGGGNQAAYTAPSGKDGPTVNVRSFTSIGEIYGGGYGKTATVTGDCYVNIDEIEGKYASDAYDEKTKTITFTEYKRTADGGFELDADGKRISEEKTVEVVLPGHVANKIGAINNVFGGGNEAKVLGSTNVNIGTKMGESKYVEVAVGTGTDVSSYYKRTGTGTTEDPYVYAAGSTDDPEGTQYYKKETVKGVDIRGNVYGGGNNAEVTGDTNVTIGKKAD